MAREPFEGSDWEERNSAERRRRRRRRFFPLMAVLGLLAIGAGAAFSGAIPSEPEQAKARQTRLARFTKALDKAEQERRERELSSKFVNGVKRSTLNAIAECESHGDPRAISSGGDYRGKYQFDRGTWKSQGGKGDPAKAPEAEQDYRASILYKAAGSSPWPICGQ